MQKKLLISLLTLAFFLIAGCTNSALLTDSSQENILKGKKGKNEMKENLAGSGQVQFAWSNRHSTPNRSSSRSHQLRPHSIDNARMVVISVENAAGTIIFTNKQLMLHKFSGKFISEPISLAPGSYKLTTYLVLDKSGEVIFATPKSDSDKAYLVKNPLPIDFTITKDKMTLVTPEIIDTDETPASEFGYATFDFDVVKTFDFLITVMHFDTVQHNFVATEAALQVINDNYTYNFTLSNTLNRISVNDFEGSFAVMVSKTGYKDYSATYTPAQLKEFFNNPLVVVIKKATPN